MRRLSLFLLLSTFAVSSAQTPQKPDEKLLTARARYYTPVSGGLRGFHCNVGFDWQKMFRSFGKSLPDDSPLLHYLHSVHLSVTDSFLKGGQLEWADTGTAPEAFTQSAAQIRDGMKQTIFGFLTTWNAFMNGSMVPAPNASITFAETAEGYRLQAVTKQYEVTEDFDRSVLLKQAHVISDAVDVIQEPVFEETPEGLRPTTITSTVRQPKTAPPVQSTMKITYAPVSGFQLPSQIGITVQNVGNFDFPLSNCSVDVEKK